MDELRASVIIPTYGREEVLCQTVRQLLDQDRPADEILVVDQTPTHAPEIEASLNQLAGEGKIRVIRQAVPSASRARNRGILEATGDILIFLDDDILIERDFIRAHLENFRDNDVAAVTGAIWSENGSTLPPVHELPAIARKEPLGWMEVPPSLAFRTEKIFTLSGNCSVRRSVAQQVGGFDENYGRYDYHADYDFGWRIHRAGGKILHEPRAGIHHLVASRGGCRVQRTRRPVPEIEELRPKFYFYLKNFPTYHSLVPFFKLLRQHVLNRANVLRPYYLPLSLWRTLVAIIRAAYAVLFIGERSLIRGYSNESLAG
ncbi:MAG: glycosyltransferase [Acidobacteria bacterium]|nr:glycosyltransferase [Acidobacteriota bacterium]